MRVDLKVKMLSILLGNPTTISYLRDDCEIDIEMQVQRLDRYVGPQTTIFPLMPKRVWCKGTIALLGHQDHRVQDTRNGRRSEYSAPYNAVGGCQIICKNSWRMRIGRYTGHIQHTACPLIGFPECSRASAKPAALASPV